MPARVALSHAAAALLSLVAGPTACFAPEARQQSGSVRLAPIPAHGLDVPRSIIGEFTLEQMRHALPDGSANELPWQKVPALPLVGNGYTGVVAQSVPGDLSSVEFGINTNDMWRVRPQPPDGAGFPVPTAHRAALGGLILTSTGGREPFINVSAEQRLDYGRLITRQWTASGAVLTTETALHPQQQVMVTNLSWSGPGSISVNVSTWAAAGNFGGRTAWPWWFEASDVDSPSSAGCCDATGALVECSGDSLLCATRNASGAPGTPREVWAGLVTRLVGGGTRGMSSVAMNVSKYPSAAVVNDTARQDLRISSASTVLMLASGGDSSRTSDTATTASLITAVRTSAFAGNATGVDHSPLPNAAALAAATEPAELSAASDAHWERFWMTSAISTPTLPELEYLWYGSLYVTKGFASSDPSVPPSGLFGPWVSSDSPAWNGDYTLCVITSYHLPSFLRVDAALSAAASPV